jgi:hypothetical protein
MKTKDWKKSIFWVIVWLGWDLENGNFRLEIFDRFFFGFGFWGRPGSIDFFPGLRDPSPRFLLVKMSGFWEPPKNHNILKSHKIYLHLISNKAMTKRIGSNLCIFNVLSINPWNYATKLRLSKKRTNQMKPN